MKPSCLATLLPQLLENRWPVFIWGPPGAGKSSVVRDVARRAGLPVIDIRASLLDPTDLRGIPAIENGRAVWCPPAFLPKAGQRGGILFFDELNAAPQLVQASLYQLTLDRRVGEYELPDGWRIVAAGNRAEDCCVTFRMPPALANRFVHLDFDIDYDDWRDWAAVSGVHPRIIGFLGVRRELLHDMSGAAERGFPTPRAWEMASDTLRCGAEPQELLEVLSGVVGEGAAIEFVGYCERSITEAQIERIIASPATEPLPADLGSQYALVSFLAAEARKRRVREAAGTLLPRLPVELAVLLGRDVLRIHPQFVADAGYRQFVAEHGELLR